MPKLRRFFLRCENHFSSYFLYGGELWKMVLRLFVLLRTE